MRNLWESRGDLDVCRMVGGEWNPNNAQSIDQRFCKWNCRLCGMPMFEVNSSGNYHIWGCDTVGCPNNQDTRILSDNNANYIINMMNAGDPNKIWTPCIPKYGV